MCRRQRWTRQIRPIGAQALSLDGARSSTAVDVAVAMLRAAKAQGAVGVEVGTNINSDRLDAPMFEAFWAAAEELGLLVMLHPTNNAPYPGLGDWYLQNAVGNPLETMIAGCRLICSGLLDRFPSIQILLVHGGGHLPYQLGRLRHAISVRKELAGLAPDPWIYAKRMNFDSLTHDAQALRYLVDRIERRRNPARQTLRQGLHRPND